MKATKVFSTVLVAVAIGILSMASSVWADSTVTPQDVQFVNNSYSPPLALTGKLFVPSMELGNGPFPAVVLMHGCSGLYYKDSKGNLKLSSSFQEWGNRLANQGYVAIFPDSFTPRGNTTGVCDQTPWQTGISEVTDRPTDAYAAYNYLRSRSYVKPNNIGLLGWSNGGSATLATISTTANSYGFRTAIAFYPGCALYNAFGGISTSTWKPYAPLVIYHGSIDNLYTDGYCQKRVQNANNGGATIDLLVYQNAQHGFDRAMLGVSPWTADDVQAKNAADNDAMNRLNTYVKNAP